MNTQPVPNYLVQSILVTLFCCLPLGIAAIVNAAQVNSKLQAGDYEGAVSASEQAKKYCLWSVYASIIVFVLYILLAIIGSLAGK